MNNNFKITFKGDFFESIKKSEKKLEDKFYSNEELSLNKNPEWPGDWTGRAIFALECLKTITGREQKNYKDNINLLMGNLNSELYFGDIIDVNNINEQQLAGNSWFLRAMCYNYENINDIDSKVIIKSVVENLYLKIIDKIDLYPSSMEKTNSGGKEGCVLKKINSWNVSTDVGCLFISIDGLSHAYKILKDERVLLLIDKLFDKLKKYDVVSNRFQTHATLTALRGLIRTYEETGNKEYLNFVIKTFDLYKKYGMTGTYANYNWFDRPLWTEPCAIVDSFIVATKLGKILNNDEYLILGNKIYYNALRFSERDNGGFGCDSCVSKDIDSLFIDNGAYDAFWCCSMRGTEGLSEIIKFAVEEKSDYLLINMPLESKIEYKKSIINIIDGFTRSDKLTIKINSNEKIRLKILVNNIELLNVSGMNASINGNYVEIETLKSKATLVIKLKENISKILFNGMIKYERGFFTLVEDVSESKILKSYAFKSYIDGKELIPIPFIEKYKRDAALKVKLKVLNYE